MTIPEAAHNVVRDWVTAHPMQECRGQQRRNLEASVFNITHSNNSYRQVACLLRIYRPIIAPERTRDTFNQRNIGESTSTTQSTTQ